MNILRIARELKACSDAIGWVEANSHLSAEQLYSRCPRGDWLLWFFAKIGVERKLLILAACDCADLVRHLLPDNAPRNTTDIVRAYYKGEATLEDVRAAYVVAYAAAYRSSAASSTATAAAYAAARAAHIVVAADAVYTAVGAVTNTIDAAIHAAYAAARITHSIRVDTARENIYKQCADVLRQYVSFETMLAALQTYQESAKR